MKLKLSESQGQYLGLLALVLFIAVFWYFGVHTKSTPLCDCPNGSTVSFVTNEALGLRVTYYDVYSVEQVGINKYHVKGCERCNNCFQYNTEVIGIQE